MVYRHVLVPLNISKLDEFVLPFIETIACIGLARRITFIHIVEKVSIPPLFEPTSGRYVNLNLMLLERTMSENIIQATDYLKERVSSLHCSKAEISWEVLPAYEIAYAISQFATINGVDLIIMASRSRTWIRRWIWGSVAHKVLKYVRIPVFTLRIPG